MRTLPALLVALAASLPVVSVAHACSPPKPADPHGWPRPGATDVPTSTSVYVLDSYVAPGARVDVRIDGALTDLGPLVDQGRAFDFGTGLSALRRLPFPGLLPASAEIVVNLANGGVELTRFTTAGGDERPPGTPPVLRSMKLMRVRYPVSEINSGTCVGAEYEGFVAFDWDAALVPHTPADAVIYTASLTPKTGGTTQSFTFLGDTHYSGYLPTSPDYFAGSYWWLDLDPTLEYCLAISAFGYGDLASIEQRSAEVCGPVTQACKPGADCGSGCSSASGGASLPGILLAFTALAARRWRRG